MGGWETLCESQQNTGYSVNGGFADYTLAVADYAGHLPSNVGFVEIAPVLCAGVTVYKGLKVTDTRPGQWVVISGRQDRGARGAGHGELRVALSSSAMATSSAAIAALFLYAFLHGSLLAWFPVRQSEHSGLVPSTLADIPGHGASQ
ncbi:MDR/zinc-dependent alcohol dehydrogenase-like family protein [Billgrantia diversa]|uniref:hypothetical protein n=1 Tax=Halomonas sp. MCCC 1A13316 TaxID=2733487 RepID=UPI003FA58392